MDCAMSRLASLTLAVVLSCGAFAAAQDSSVQADPKNPPKTDSKNQADPNNQQKPETKTDQKAPQTVEIIGERVKDLQQTPSAGFDVDAATLERRRVSSIQDLTKELPNISSTDGGAPGVANVYSVRGLVNGAFFAGPSLTVYVDDIPFGDPFTYIQPLGVLDSAQVLLGPQFTTFGRYPYGGVINIVTRRPTDTLEGGVFGEGGNHGLLNSGGYLMGALLPGELRFRFAADEEMFGGVIHNSTFRKMDDSIYRVGGNFSLFYTPTPNWDIAFVSDVHKYQNGAPRENSLFAPDHYETSSDFQGRTNLLTDQEALRVGYKMSGIQLLSVTTRRSFNIDPADVDLDFTSTPGSFARIIQNETIVSQEFRVKGDDPHSDVDWSAGVYGHLKNNTQNGGHGFIVTGLGAVTDSNVFFSHEHWGSVFGDLDYKGIKKWHFRLGARFDYVSETMDQTTQIPAFGETIAFNLKDRFPMGSFKAGVDYELSDTSLLYVSGGHAYKPGGFSAFAGSAATAPFHSEKNWFVEAGEKSTFFDGKLKLNGSVFYYDISNYQLERVTNNGNDYFVINVNSAHSLGAEGEIRGQVLPFVEVFAQGGIVRTLLGDYEDGGVTHGPGVVAPFVPRYTGVLGASGKYKGFFAHAEWVATGTTHYDDLNPSFLQSNYAQLNAGIGYGGDHWKVTLFGNNLNNRFYWTNMVGGGTDIGSPALPREMGVRLDVTF
jgi:iron complex outermembrane receptor protein